MSKTRLSLWRIYRVPSVIAVSGLGGLIIALLGDGAWNWTGAALLSGAVLATLWACAKRRL